MLKKFLEYQYLTWSRIGFLIFWKLEEIQVIVMNKPIGHRIKRVFPVEVLLEANQYQSYIGNIGGEIGSESINVFGSLRCHGASGRETVSSPSQILHSMWPGAHRPRLPEKRLKWKTCIYHKYCIESKFLFIFYLLSCYFTNP